MQWLNFRISALILPLMCTMPFAAHAQALQCEIPRTLPAAILERPPAGAINRSPTTGNILALSWSPQYCRTNGRRDAIQCSGQNGSFGFILHGLWPDGPGQNDPAWCAPAETLPPALIRQNLCRMPSVRLQQHEWAKHGTCASKQPSQYFKASALLFDALKWPDMNALSRDRVTTEGFLKAFVLANPGLRTDMLRVDTAKGGWLKEVRLCLDIDYKPKRCPRDQRSANPRVALKIWRISK